jgi:hypothetical protein
LETFLYLNGKKSIRSLSNGQIAGVSERMIPERIYETKEVGPIEDPSIRVGSGFPCCRHRKANIE